MSPDLSFSTWFLYRRDQFVGIRASFFRRTANTSSTSSSLMTRSELFRGLDPPALRQVEEVARAVSLQRNDVVFAQDDRAEELFVVRSGRIAIAQRSSDGRQTMVALMEREDLFGDMPLFDGR